MVLTDACSYAPIWSLTNEMRESDPAREAALLTLHVAIRRENCVQHHAVTSMTIVSEQFCSDACLAARPGSVGWGEHYDAG